MSKPKKPRPIKAPTCWSVTTMQTMGVSVRDARRLAKWLLDYANYLAATSEGG